DRRCHPKHSKRKREMKFKRKPALDSKKKEPQYSDTIRESDSLAAWRVERNRGDKQMTVFVYVVFKHVFIENGRLLAGNAPGGFILLGSFLSEAERDRAVSNIRASGTSVIHAECPAPENLRGFEPMALVLPKRVTEASHLLLCADQDLAEDHQDS